jgi:uncharacterized protein (TIGR03435 family)
MNKPLHKDPSFWIVAIVALGFANVAQLSLALPWFKQKLLAMQPAPRMPIDTGQSVDAGRFVVATNPELDYSRKTHPWQRPQFDPQVLDNLPPQVVLIPTEYSPPSGGWTMRRADKAIGIRIPALSVLQTAYQWESPVRMALPEAMPDGYYDYVASGSEGAFESLQKEVETKLGLVATIETRPMDALLLRVHHTNAPDLSPLVGGPVPTPGEPGRMRFNTIQNFISFLETITRMPVIDKTSLIGNHTIWISQTDYFPRSNIDSSQHLTRIKETLTERLGLELVETNAPVEVLAVKRVNDSP